MSDSLPDGDSPALAVVELSSIARAFLVADAMIKRAPALLWRTHTISPGHFLIFLTGGVAEVDESCRAGLLDAAPHIVDHVFLPRPEPQILAFMRKPAEGALIDALGIIETRNCVAAIRGADAALKVAAVTLVHLHLGQGIGGKGVFAFTGELPDVQAALEEGVYAAREELVLAREEIPAPHGGMTLSMLGLGSRSPDY